MLRFVRYGLAPGLAALTLGACGSTAQPSTATPTRNLGTAASTPTPAAGLPGSYWTTLTGTDHYGPAGKYSFPDQNLGMWTLNITGNSASFVKPGGDGFPVGSSFSYSGNQVTIGIDPNCNQLDPPTATTGVYTYLLSGNMLTFQKVSDSCLPRAATLTLHPWRRQS